MAAKNRRNRQNGTNGLSQRLAATMAARTDNQNGDEINAVNGSNDNGNNLDPEQQINAVTGDDESPLKLFGEAKDKINKLYSKLDDCVAKACKFYTETKLGEDVIQNSDKQRLLQLNKSIDTIRSVLSRNQMKVAFFGRTSNGKSTVINAILHDKVLPMGYGHTTGCFLQIQGSTEHEAFLEIQKDGQSEEKKPIQSVTHIANALNSGSLEYSTLVKIYWPISKCPLLKYDVVLVDSPGVDVEENLDEWIDEHCRDADVFVLVSNAESTLNIAEKNFFHKVSEKLSKPNIFILNNRWDSIADDFESLEQVKRQHIERAVNFLCDELKISSEEEAKRKTFFVSARETLQTRSPLTIGSPNSTLRKEGFDDRREEFINFERSFEESLSRSAVKTKFKKHSDKGRETIHELTQILNSTRDCVVKVSQDKISELQWNQDRCQSINNLFYVNETKLQEQINEIKKRIQIVTDTEFENEIRRLSRIVEDFDMHFSPNFDKLQLYKEQLCLHVERCLSEDLKTRITTVINKHINPFNKVMCDISQLLNEERQQRIKNIVSSQVYIQDELFDLRIYKQFYTEFQEDLEFRFSLGLVSIVRKFQSKFSKSHKSTDQFGSPVTLSTDTDVLSVVERFMMNPPQSTATISSLAVGGALVRTVGWRVIIITTVVYGALYAYEYLTWTNSAKERTFKAQYVRYARKGLMDCVPIISQHIANSVEQKMMVTFSRVKKEVDNESSEAQETISMLRNSLEKLQICEEFTKQLIGQNDVLLTEMINFATSFLSA